MEKCEPHALSAVVGHEDGHKQTSARQLHREGEDEDALDEFEYAALAERARGLRD